MPLFSRKMLRETISFETALDQVLSAGEKRPFDNRLLPKEIQGIERVIWLEALKHAALKHDGDFANLEAYTDFRWHSQKHRPDPTRGEWLWLYSQIGEHHHNLLLCDLFEIMVYRDAFLPFFDSIPDKDLWDKFSGWLPQGMWTKESAAIPYQGLEAAILEDAPAKVTITKMMCRHITDKEILNRAVTLEKGSVVAAMIKNAPIDQVLEILINAHTNWENPASLFERVLPQRVDEIAAWRDPWCNGFFWYLYRRPEPSMDIIRSLPPKILSTFETENRYGISPKDLWSDYCPHLD